MTDGDISPSALANAIMGKLYDVLTNGDAGTPSPTAVTGTPSAMTATTS